MTLRKSDLYSSLWKSCDELRGGMDASQYKDYILTLLFVKYVSDKQKADPDSLIDVPAGGSFDDMVSLKGDKEIGDKLNKIIAKLAEANSLQKVIDQADFNDEEKLGKGKEMQDRLSKLVAIFADLDFRGSSAEGDDLLGDAYEYLMRHFATEAGKSKGQFYTPAEVSRILAKVVGIGPSTRQDQTVYDPTCGSGSLLLKAAAEAPRGVTIYGQEKDNATWALSKMNMILHGNEIADLRKGDTITSPQFTQGNQLKTFDFVVMNPPFSTKSWTNGLEHDYGRFEFGMPPPKNGDYAFLLHALKSLKSTGKAAVILPHGVLFRGNAEAIIRKALLQRGYIKGVIGLPPNLFYGTGIPACIVVLDKENAQARTGVFMVDASRGFMKDGAKNRLRSQDIHRIVDVFTKQTDIDRYARMVPMSEIADPRNDFNLNIPRYIDSSEPEDIQDLHAHVHGGIPERDIDDLSHYWDAFPQLRSQLFEPNRPGYVDLAVDVTDVQQTVLDSPEFQKFVDQTRALTDGWYAANRSSLQTISPDTRPNDLIATISEDLLARFRPAPLLDEYDAYEQLMTYWHTVMHDDVFLVMHEGWVNASRPRPTIEDKDRKLTETPDLEIGAGRKKAKYKMDLVPPSLIVARYYADDQARVDELNAAAESAAQAVDEFVEEHGADEGLLSDAVNEKGKLNQAAAKDALKDAKAADDTETAECAQAAIELLQAEAAANKTVKEAQSALDTAALKQYGGLTDADVQSLVLDDKWAATIRDRVDAEVYALTLDLVSRIQQLGERYAETVGALDAELEELDAKVAGHLADMGVGMVQQLLTGKTRLSGFAKPWTTKTLGELGTFLKGRGIKRDEVLSTGIRCVRYGELYTAFDDYTFEARSFVSAGVAARALPLRTGDVLFAGSGETRDEIGKCVAYVGPTPAVAGGDVIVLRGGQCNSIYLAVLANTPDVVSQKARVGQGDAVVHIYSHALAAVEVTLPSREEQDAIAAALRDADTEIQRLHVRLAKARNVKQGMMQELLTGRTRLPVGEPAP